ncbi:concanavalin A-like lectin/glucanase domain-containing protein [Xylaria intraflava]|nr:concanavalin A-like lectin/glucanase domain-containing protein [Xylaria intraflava]
MVGWDPGSWGYHGDNGRTYTHPEINHGNKYGDTYSSGATIGCGVNFKKETAFFTLNGKLIGPAFRGIKGKLYPAVSFSTERPSGKITANFGPEGFRYEAWASDKNTEESSPTQSQEVTRVDEDSDDEWETRRR